MSGYKGPRGPNVSQYIANLNQLSPVTEALAEPQPTSDDFSAFQAEAPGCYAFIGAGGEYPHHHPRFVIDERALAIGTRLHVDVALRALADLTIRRTA